MVIEIRERSQTSTWSPHTALADGMGDSGVFHVTFDPESDTIVEVIVQSVASIKNVEPVSLSPLASYVDPAMLESLVGHASNGMIRQAEVTFGYEGMNITVESDGDLWLEWDESDGRQCR